MLVIKALHFVCTRLIDWGLTSLSGVFQLYHDLTVVHDCILEAVP